MNFKELAEVRQSCRNYSDKEVEKTKICEILRLARLSPSACNGQPYHISVCSGESGAQVAAAVQGAGMNKFASGAKVFFVISEEPYVPTAAIGAKLKKNDYRSIDIGILSSYITLAATELGLGSCILGWLDSDKLKKICGVSGEVRLVICVGYADESDSLREKKRKSLDKLVTEIN